MTTVRLSMTTGERKALIRTCDLVLGMLQAPEFQQERDELERNSGMSNTVILNSVTLARHFVASGETESSVPAAHGLAWLCAAALLSARQDDNTPFAAHRIHLPLLKSFYRRLDKAVRRAAE